MTAQPVSTTEPREELVRKLFSLSGVVPLGAFLAIHLYTNSIALRGQAAFTAAVRQHREFPMGRALEIGLVLIPLVFHAVYGAYIAIKQKPLRAASPYSPALLRAMRVTGLLAFVYVLWHLYEYRFAAGAAGMPAEHFHTTLTAHLSATRFGFPIAALIDLSGTFVTCFHFAVGLYGFAATTRIAQRASSNRPRRALALVAGGLGVALFFASANLVLFFATGSRFIGPSESLPVELDRSTPCPQPS